MSTRRRGRRSRVPDSLGGKLFGGSRRTARAFVAVVVLVFALVGVLVLQTWLRVEMVETMQENRQIRRDHSCLSNRVICREVELERSMARDRIVGRAQDDLGLHIPEPDEVVFVPESGACISPAQNSAIAARSREGRAL
ncbi:MAG: hypothetical protein KAW17_00765 [Candidatus Eisenbacteria sp.]|nr:hypothetical protein [Candidatus Eisenbacteria bacterium]